MIFLFIVAVLAIIVLPTLAPNPFVFWFKLRKGKPDYVSAWRGYAFWFEHGTALSEIADISRIDFHVKDGLLYESDFVYLDNHYSLKEDKELPDDVQLAYKRYLSARFEEVVLS